MNELLKKLNFKTQKTILISNSPKSFEKQIADFQQFINIETEIGKLDEIEFFLGFVTKQEEINTIVPKIVERIKDDNLFWLAYPKGTSKNYKCNFNRDTGWEILGKLGFEPVRMIAIDEDWSALRFRKADFIKKMTRSFAMSEKGKAKVKAASE